MVSAEEGFAKFDERLRAMNGRLTAAEAGRLDLNPSFDAPVAGSYSGDGRAGEACRTAAAGEASREKKQGIVFFFFIWFVMFDVYFAAWPCGTSLYIAKTV